MLEAKGETVEEGEKTSDETEINDDVATSDLRTLKNLIPATIKQINAFISKAFNLNNKYQYIKVADVTPELVQTLKNAGINVEGCAHLLKDNSIRHIDKSHGSKSNDKYKVTGEDISRVKYIVENADNIYQGYDTSAGHTTIAYELSEGARTFYVEEMLTEGGLSPVQMMIVGKTSKPSFLKKYKKIASKPSDTSVTAQSRTTSISSPGNHAQDADGNTDNIEESSSINSIAPSDAESKGENCFNGA